MEHFKSAKNQEESAQLDKPYGFDLLQTLQQKIIDLDGVALEIVVKESHPNGKMSQRSLIFKLKDDDQSATQQRHSEDVDKLIQRLAALQNNYSHILQAATAKVSELHKEYRSRDYSLQILKHNKTSEAVPLGYEKSSSSILKRQNSPNTNLDTNVKRKISSVVIVKHDKSSSATLKRKNSSNSNRNENQPTPRRRCIEEYPKTSHKDPNMLIIGPNGTQMHRKSYATIRWKGGMCTTSELCDIVFGQRTLARHSDRGQLDPSKTSDITYVVCSKFKVTSQLVRDTIASKCVEAAKRSKRFPEKRRRF